jgi:uncharacterized protein YybS (DUF2232 family)
MQTKALVEGAIFAGVTALLGIIYYYMQYLGIIAMVWPVPVIIVGYRNGLKASILSALAAGLIVSLMTHPLVGIGLLAGFGLPGIVMGYMIKRKLNPYLIVAACGLLLSFTMVGEFLLSLKASGIDFAQLVATIDTTYRAQTDMVLGMYRGMGIAEKELETISSYFSQTLDMMKLIFPSALVVSGVLFSFIDYKLTRLILKRIGYTISDVEEFSRMRLPEPYSLVLLGLSVLSGAVSYFKLQGFTAAALNVSTVLMLVFTILGLSVVVFYSRVYGERYGVPKALRVIITVIIVLMFMQMIAFLGILDMVMDFRKLKSKYPGGVR